MNAFDTIKERISVRSYREKPVEAELRKELEDYYLNLGSGPFGAAVRFDMLDLEPLDKNELRRFGTYGMIKGANLYILGAVREEPGALEDLGYSMEKIILKATSLGLGTCWLGGTFRRSAFASKMNLAENELLPAVTPVGYAAGEVSTSDKIARYTAGSKKRKPWDELFFREDGKTPMPKEDAGQYADALEAVRMGPSASNRQPWRIVQEKEGIFHLFLQENKVYNRLLGKIRIQNIDMGIAMCHFELVAREQGLKGSWVVDNYTGKDSGRKYIASWIKK